MHRNPRIRRGALAAILALGASLALRAPESQGAPGQTAPRAAPAKNAAPAAPGQPAARPSPAEIEAARAAFGDVARVLLSPRCRNCHPAGDSPLHGDAGVPHSMNISRRSPEAGLHCTACHRERNHAVAGAPPGAPNWHMPDRETPMVFEGHTPRSLCLQLKDPEATGGRSVGDLVDHVEHDPFVLWGWEPGPGRSKPPISHAEFVTRVRQWAEAGGPCPEE